MLERVGVSLCVGPETVNCDWEFQSPQGPWGAGRLPRWEPQAALGRRHCALCSSVPALEMNIVGRILTSLLMSGLRRVLPTPVAPADVRGQLEKVPHTSELEAYAVWTTVTTV